MCHNAVDRHVEAGLGERKAIVWDSAITDSKSTLTYAQLRETLVRHVPHYTIYTLLRPVGRRFCGEFIGSCESIT